MKKLCVYCGRVHDSRLDCGHKPKRHETDSRAQHIRNRYRWRRTREAVRERDNNICQLCLRNYKGALRPYEYEGLEIHHIIPIEEDENKAFDMQNLITLCKVHHEQAERGEITREILTEIAKENERRRGGSLEDTPLVE